MSTNININVGDNKLLAQARLQQNASRQAQLEKEANQRLKAQATDAQTANLDPLTGTPYKTPQLKDRPAANRQFGIGFGECFYRIQNSVGTNLQIQITVWSGDGTAQVSKVVENSGYPVGYRTLDEVYGSLPPEGITATTQIVRFAAYGGEAYSSPGSLEVNESLGLNRDPGAIERIITLPTGKDSAIICFLGKVCCYKSVGYIVYDIASSTSTTQYPISEGVDYLLAESFFVTKTTVKTIATPNGLIDALRSSKTFENIKNDPQTQFIQDSIVVSTAPAPVQVSGTFLVFNGINRPFPASWDNNNAYVKQDYIDYWRYQNQEEALGGVGSTARFLQGWGVEPLASADPFQVNSIGLSSPGIYDAISKLLPYNDNNTTQLNSIKQLVTSAGQKAKWIRLRNSSSSVPTKRYVDLWPLQLPEVYYLQDQFGNYVISAFDDLSWRQYKEYERTQPSSTFRRFWSDWGKASYCKGKALELGFTSADLTP